MRASRLMSRDGRSRPSLSRFCRVLATKVVLAMTLGAAPIAARAQLFARPWLDWHTVHAGRFDVHYPTQLASWAQFVAARLPAIDSAVTTLVGYAPPNRVQIVVEDPFDISNGFAFTLIDHPVIVFWASPPDPRESIGQFRTWGEMLATHEYGHVAHLTRPSRNPLTRWFWKLAPVDLGPIALRSPRWVFEGYATYIEGRVTGTGRPHGVWRPAILRQWAIEGRLPTYAQMSEWGDFAGGEFAYLAGSAFFEYLARHNGDSSIVDLWRRMTARTNRSFDQAFAGVYGDLPTIVYDRFRAEVTAEAVNVDSAMLRTMVEGELVQHLARGTGDPAISRDGAHAAIVLRSTGRPSRVVVWNTAPEPDTIERRSRERLRKEDPEDVPARRVYPLAKHALATLIGSDGRSYEDPRWLPDGQRVLLWRSTRRTDGTYRPELYLWDYTRGDVRRLTSGAGVRNADPSPDGRRAIALRCPGGYCDLVIVDLQSGRLQTIAPGDVLTTYARPRWSPDGSSIAVALQRENRWRIALFTERGGPPRFVDPDDGANRFDPAWLNSTTLLAVSDHAGAPNLERLDVASVGRAVQLTNVTGAAVAPAPNDKDGSIWFLSLYSGGYDLRRLVATSPTVIDSPSPLTNSRLTAIAIEPSAHVRSFGPSPTVMQTYGIGERTTHWLPAGSISTTGREATFALINTDVVGRLTILGQGALGSGDVWRGGSIDALWRGWRPAFRVAGFDAKTSYPMLGGGAVGTIAVSDQLGGVRARLDQSYAWEHSDVRLGVGGALSRLDEQFQQLGSTGPRNLAFAELAAVTRRSGDRGSASASLNAMFNGGTTADVSYQRFVGSVAARADARGLASIDVGVSYGEVSSDAANFEQFVVGGPPTILLDPSLLTQRIAMGALPAGVARGSRIFQYRAASSLMGLSPYYWGASTRDGAGRFSVWHRVIGAELAIDQSALPVLGLPGARLLAGIGYSLDEPFAHETRGYLTVTLRP